MLINLKIVSMTDYYLTGKYYINFLNFHHQSASWNFRNIKKILRPQWNIVLSGSWRLIIVRSVQSVMFSLHSVEAGPRSASVSLTAELGRVSRASELRLHQAVSHQDKPHLICNQSIIVQCGEAWLSDRVNCKQTEHITDSRNHLKLSKWSKQMQMWCYKNATCSSCFAKYFVNCLFWILSWQWIYCT